jgi:hypothetical protein
MLHTQALINPSNRIDQPAGECDNDQAARLRLRSARDREVESSHIVKGTLLIT